MTTRNGTNERDVVVVIVSSGTVESGDGFSRTTADAVSLEVPANGNGSVPDLSGMSSRLGVQGRFASSEP